MAAFGITTINTHENNKYMKEVHQKLQKHNPITSPYTGGINAYPQANNTTLYAISITPTYPRTYYLTLMPLTLYIIHPKTWILIITIIMASTGLLWTYHLHSIILRIGMRKHTGKQERHTHSPTRTLQTIIKNKPQPP